MGGLWVSISGIGYNVAIGWGKTPFLKPMTRNINDGGVVQLVRTSACHAEGRGFEPRLHRHFFDDSPL